MPPLEDAAGEAAAVAGIVGEKISGMERIGGGRNSRVFRADGASGGRWAVKFYFTHDSDLRDRLMTEFNGLTFLWERGIRSIARPIGSEPRLACGVYEFLDGDSFPPEAPCGADIDRALDFLEELKNLAPAGIAAGLPPASEACFSLEALVENLNARLKRVESARGDGRSHGELRTFLGEELAPALEKIVTRARRLSAQERTLPAAARNLSPSDFGFHNALRCAEGVKFLDFEYFGVDDPAKTLSDFLLHPGMSLPDSLKVRFAAGMLARFGGGLKARFDALYPLYALKWCLILLNEFTKEDGRRRDFSNGAGASGEDARAVQLKKARAMLALARRGGAA